MRTDEVDEVLAVCTSTNARKLTALRRNPAVALTIGTEVHPPDVLLLRGEAELDPVDGMVRIVVRPRWARLVDFENTLPESIQELMDRRSARQTSDSGDQN